MHLASCLLPAGSWCYLKTRQTCDAHVSLVVSSACFCVRLGCRQYLWEIQEHNSTIKQSVVIVELSSIRCSFFLLLQKLSLNSMHQLTILQCECKTTMLLQSWSCMVAHLHALPSHNGNGQIVAKRCQLLKERRCIEASAPCMRSTDFFRTVSSRNHCITKRS